MTSSPPYTVSVMAPGGARFPTATARDEQEAIALASERMTAVKSCGPRELTATVSARGPHGVLLYKILAALPDGQLVWVDLLTPRSKVGEHG